jgi:hypothetical protein
MARGNAGNFLVEHELPAAEGLLGVPMRRR